MHLLATLQKRWADFAQTPKGKKIRKRSKQVFFIAIVAYLIYQFSKIGWINIWHSMPNEVSFYLLYLPIFFILPISELFIYRILWGIRFRDIWPALLIKKVYNSDVMGYSGEVFLYHWASQSLTKKKSTLIHDIKDNNIISSIVSIIVTFAVVILFLNDDPNIFAKWLKKIPNSEIYYIIIFLIFIIAILIVFKKYIFTQSLETSSKIFSVHLIRHIIVFFIQIYQWHIVLPKVPFYVWVTFMAVFLVMTRLPFLSNVDLIFLGVSINLSHTLGVPVASISAIMALNSVMGKILHFCIYTYFNVFAKDKLFVSEAESSEFTSFSQINVEHQISSD